MVLKKIANFNGNDGRDSARAERRLTLHDILVARTIAASRNPIGMACVFILGAIPALAQDLEPRRWSHLPLGSNFAGAGYAYTEGDISLNPVLRITEGTFELDTIALKYIHSFEMLGKSARFDLAQAYQSGTWSGVINAMPASVDRDGWADSQLRFAVNLYGAPPLTGQEFLEYRRSTPCETIVGMGLVVQVPTGEYFGDKLINLGTNRYTISPQLGVVHNRGKWSGELSTSASFYTNNDEFFGGSKLEDDVYFIGQGHLIYTFRPGLWLGASAGFGYGGESTINGVSADDREFNLGWGISLGIPVNRSFGFKIGYVGTRTQEDIGADTDTFAIACSLQW
jgi:hypothetical protein